MGILRRSKPKAETSNEPVLPPLELKPTAFDKSAVQAELIGARQLPGFPLAITMLAQALSAGGDRILMDFTAQGVNVRNRVDGVWEALPAMDRASGDATLFIVKKLWGMNPADRRSSQLGKCNVAFQGNDWILECASQGVQTGERVLISVLPKKPIHKTLGDIGMRDKMQEQLKGLLGAHGGLVVISAPAGHGLPTTWRVAIESADKFTRDWVSVEDKKDADPEMINVTQHFFDSKEGETPDIALAKLILKQPDVYVMPNFFSEHVVDSVLSLVKAESKHAVTRIQANDPIDAIISLMTSYRGQAKELLMTINGVLSQRLVRRLCIECRQAYQPSPQLLQKLGVPAGRITQLYQPFTPPPPEQRVDAKGNPIEIPICKKCKGRGYSGRVGIFELLIMSNELRSAIAKNAKDPSVIRQHAKKLGHLSFQDEGILAVATGLTSLQELQRIAQGK